MKDVKDYLKLWRSMLQTTLIAFGAAILGIPLLMAVITYFVSNVEQGMTYPIDIAYLMYLWILFLGGIYSTKLFGIAMSIRANRTSYSYGMGVMILLTGTFFGSIYYVVGQIIAYLSSHVETLKGLEVVGNDTWIKLVMVSIVIASIGCMIGSFYHKVSSIVFFMANFTLFILFIYMKQGTVDGNEVAVSAIVIEHIQNRPLVASGIGIAAFMVSVLNLKNCPLQKAQVSTKRKGKTVSHRK